MTFPFGFDFYGEGVDLDICNSFHFVLKFFLEGWSLLKNQGDGWFSKENFFFLKVR